MLNFGDGNPFATSETSTSVMDTDTLDSDQNQPNGQGSEELDEEEEDGEFCICRKGSYGSMINCEACEEWFHGKCIGIDKNMADRLPHFVCHNCNNGTQATRGKTCGF
jgi:COMPASS component SPP1